MIYTSPRWISLSCAVLLTSCAQQPSSNNILSESAFAITSPQSINTPFSYDPLASHSLLTNNAELTPSQPQASIVPQQFNQFRGVVNVVAGQTQFSLCNSNGHFILAPDSKLLKQLQYRNNQAAYVEFEGEITTSQQLDDSNNAKINVTQLHYLTANTNKCLFPASSNQFELAGRKPTWYGSGKENSFSFKIKDIDSQWQITKSIVTKGANALVNTQGEANERLDISFSGKGCTDNKNNYWQYFTRIKLKGRELRGCGKYPNNYSERRDWQGKYRYSNAKVTVDLQLDEQLQASALYTYANGRKVLETGYWHLFGSAGLKLLITHRQGLPIHKEFQFSREGDGLYTNQQWQNNKQYSYRNAMIGFNPVTIESQQVAEKTSVKPRQFSPISMKSPATASTAINAAVKDYFTMHQTDFNDSKYLFSEYDLNGDGNKDLLVLLDWCQTAGCVLLVFENQQGRYRFSSRITQVQTPIQISSKQSQQWQSLLLKNNQGWRLVDYDGISYPPESRLGSIPMQRDFTGVKLIDNQLSANWGISIN